MPKAKFASRLPGVHAHVHCKIPSRLAVAAARVKGYASKQTLRNLREQGHRKPPSDASEMHGNS